MGCCAGAPKSLVWRTHTSAEMFEASLRGEKSGGHPAHCFSGRYAKQRPNTKISMCHIVSLQPAGPRRLGCCTSCRVERIRKYALSPRTWRSAWPAQRSGVSDTWETARCTDVLGSPCHGIGWSRCRRAVPRCGTPRASATSPARRPSRRRCRTGSPLPGRQRGGAWAGRNNSTRCVLMAGR